MLIVISPAKSLYDHSPVSFEKFTQPDFLPDADKIVSVLKKKKPLHSSFIFSLYNATGRENPYSVYFKTENGSIRSYQYSVIGVPVFTATWLFKLGNYASE